MPRLATPRAAGSRPGRPTRTARLARLARLSPAAIAALLGACSGGGGDNAGPITGPGGSKPAPSSFSGQVSGGVSHAFGGVAYYFASPSAGDGGGLALAMGTLEADSTFKDVVAFGRRNAALPAPGTYAIHDLSTGDDPPADAFTLLAGLEPGDRPATACVGTGGTLTVRSVSGGRVRGSYSAQARCTDHWAEDGYAAATLTGTFDAVQHEVLDAERSGARPARAHAARASR